MAVLKTAKNRIAIDVESYRMHSLASKCFDKDCNQFINPIGPLSICSINYQRVGIMARKYSVISLKILPMSFPKSIILTFFITIACTG